MTDEFLRIENVRQTFRAKRDPSVALCDINLAVAHGECITLIGYSGCSESTLLNLIVGLTRSTMGGLTLAEREIAGPGLNRAMMSRNRSLLSRFTCLDSVYLTVGHVFGKSETKVQLRDRTYTALALIDLPHVEQKYPYEISSGIKQHVGIARALSMEPRVLLVDEPFGAPDALTRTHLQDELLKIAAVTDSVMVTVTHDVDEAVLLAGRIVMMANGPATTIGEVLTVDLP